MPTIPTQNNDGTQPVITFAARKNDLDLYQPLVKEYNSQNTDARVMLIPVDDAVIYNWSKLAAAADTFMLPDNPMISADQGSYFLDLQPLIDSDLSFNPKDFWPGMIAACQDSEGNGVSLPIGVKIEGIFYDPKAFDAGGLDYPKPGWSWDEFRKDVKVLAVTQSDHPRYGFTDGLDLSTSILTPLIDASLAANVGDIDPQYLANSLQWYFDLVKDQSLYTFLYFKAAQTYDKKQALFFQNPPAMWVDELGSYYPSGNYGLALDDYGFVPFPISAADKNDATTLIKPTCAAISRGTQHPQVAWRWLAFLSQHWVQTKESPAWQQIPAGQSAAESYGYWKSLPETAKDTVRFAMNHIDSQFKNQTAHIVIGNAIKQRPNGDLVDILATAQQDLAGVVVATRRPIEVAVAPPPAWAENLTLIRWLSMSVAGTSEISTEQALLDQYSQDHPGVLFIRPSASSDFNEMVADSDCGRNYPAYPWTDQDAAGFLDVTPLVDQENAAFKADYDSALLDRFRYEGDLYGLPSESVPDVVYYNNDLLKDLGIQPPSADWTIDEFISLATKVASSDLKGHRYGFIEPDSLFLLTAHGKTGIDTTVDPPLVTLDSQSMIESVRWLTGLVHDRVMYNAESYFTTDVAQLFKEGQVAFWIGPMGDPLFYVNGSDKSIDYQIGAVPLPLGKDGKAITDGIRTPGYFITSNTTNAVVCWDIIKYLSNDPNVSGGVPARDSIAESSTWETAVGKDYAPVYRQAAERELNAPITYANPIWQPLLVWQYQSINSILNSGADPKETLSEAQAKATSYLACVQGLRIDTSIVQQLTQEMAACALQADPQGHW